MVPIWKVLTVNYWPLGSTAMCGTVILLVIKSTTHCNETRFCTVMRVVISVLTLEHLYPKYISFVCS